MLGNKPGRDMHELREEEGWGGQPRRQREQRAEKAGEQRGLETAAGRAHLLCPLASHPGPGLRTLLRGGSCTLRLRDARGHLGLGSSCCRHILRLHPPSLGQSLPRLGRLGAGGCPLPGRGCLGPPGGTTGTLWGSLLGRGGSLRAWEGHATDTCRLREIKDVVLTQESCLGTGGIHVSGTRGLGESAGRTWALGRSPLGLGGCLGLWGRGRWSPRGGPLAVGQHLGAVRRGEAPLRGGCPSLGGGSVGHGLGIAR